MFGLSRKKAFDLAAIDRGHHQVSYKGVPAVKCPFDYVLYQMLLSELQPDLVIEIGTNRGGAALYLADLLSLLGNGVLHAIDLPSNQENEALHQHPRIRVFKQGYEGYDTKEISGFKKVLVIEDGSHMYEDVLATLHKFAPLVSPGSYMIVEDGIVDDLGLAKQYNGGPQRAIREFLATNRQFSIDRRWCDFFGHNATFNVDGYLKRME